VQSLGHPSAERPALGGPPRVRLVCEATLPKPEMTVPAEMRPEPHGSSLPLQFQDGDRVSFEHWTDVLSGTVDGPPWQEDRAGLAAGYWYVVRVVEHEQLLLRP
jgi:hypothetical protein